MLRTYQVLGIIIIYVSADETLVKSMTESKLVQIEGRYPYLLTARTTTPSTTPSGLEQ